MSKEAIFVPGIWGPFYSSILPGLWDTEGGQSAAGKVVSITNLSKEEFDQRGNQNPYIEEISFKAKINIKNARVILMSSWSKDQPITRTIVITLVQINSSFRYTFNHLFLQYLLFR